MSSSFSPIIDELIQALRQLPGIGPKSAQRLALHILQHNKTGGKQLADALYKSIDIIRHCDRCRTLCETAICRLCSNERRDASLLCVVSSPLDIIAIENTGHYRGLYFVLMGHLSPLDGIGPHELGLGVLNDRFNHEPIQELIIAVGATVEGQVTAHYIAEMAKNHGIITSQLAQGVPIGGELDYIDSNTLAHAFFERKIITP